MQSPAIKYCIDCKREFTCNVESNPDTCTCNLAPSSLLNKPEPGCRCTACLGALLHDCINAAISSNNIEPLTQTAQPYYKTSKFIEHIDYTIEQGQYIFSAWYHIKRGSCCANGCRHCPYGNGTL